MAVKVEYKADVEFTGWVINTNEAYMPLVITINNNDYSLTPKNGETPAETINEFAARIKRIIEDLTKEYAANTSLASNLTISCYWAFDGVDTNDTALGKLETAPTVKVTITCTVSQLDTYPSRQ